MEIGARLKTSIDWITDVSAFGFSLAAALTTAIGKALLGLDIWDRWRFDDEDKVFVYLPVAIAIGVLWYLIWRDSTAQGDPARRVGRWFAVLNILLLWMVAAGFDLGEEVTPL